MVEVEGVLKVICVPLRVAGTERQGVTLEPAQPGTTARIPVVRLQRIGLYSVQPRWHAITRTGYKAQRLVVNGRMVYIQRAGTTPPMWIVNPEYVP